jgi:hypothetical protein
MDGGGGYIYFDEKAGREFSAVMRWRYNFINPSTQYRNRINLHVDYAASQFVTNQIQVGYYFQQITGSAGLVRDLARSNPASRASAAVSAACSRQATKV